MTEPHSRAEVAVVLEDLLLELAADGVEVDPERWGLRSARYSRLALRDRLRTWVVRHDLVMAHPETRELVELAGSCEPRNASELRWSRRVVAAVARGNYPSGRAIVGSSGSLGVTARRYQASVLGELGWGRVGRGINARWVPPAGSPILRGLEGTRIQRALLQEQLWRPDEGSDR